jgi:dienelactone hydrolase
MSLYRVLLISVAFVMSTVAVRAADSDLPLHGKFSAHDSLDVGEESSEDARLCLDGLRWEPADFEVSVDPADPEHTDHGDALIRFPSPIVSGDERNDGVAVEWYVARDMNGQPVSAPAVVVVHESGSGMTVGRMFARGLQRQGLHTFMVQLPFYGHRRTGRKRPDDVNMVTVIRQAVADVRRTRDAVSVLPLVDRSHIALQGTSLGGFVSATAGSLDHGFDSVHLMLAGGNLYDLIQKGKRDTEKVRQELEKAGLTGDNLRQLTMTIEPTRIAHRLDPQRTWLYSGTLDSVVPIENAVALAEAVPLDKEHHFKMFADHYTGIVFLPNVLKYIGDQVKRLHAERK